MQDLSTDPQVLLEQMRRQDSGPLTPAEDFTRVGDFLRGTDASPALRAALYRVAALIPGVTLLGHVRDHLGRLGLGIALTAKGVTHELIVNPRSGELLGEADHGTAPGTDDWSVSFGPKLVDSLPRRSPIPLTPACRHSEGIVHSVPGGSVIVGQGGN